MMIQRTLTKPFEILLIEDDDDHASLLERGLKNGIEVSITRKTHGKEAIEYLESHPLPHLVLLDLKLPDMHGLEVLEQIKSHPKLRVLPVVILSTSSSKKEIEVAYKKNANAYVTKPQHGSQFLKLGAALLNFWAQYNLSPVV